MQKRDLFFLSLIIAAGALLRAFKIDTNYFFTGELGKELLYMRQFAMSHTLPLIGMATSHPWLSYGPFYYWIMIPVFDLFKGNPFILFWAAFAVAITGLILNYKVIEKIADKKLAMFSTLVMAVSPVLISQTRLSKLHVFFFILSPIFMLFLYFMWKGNKKWVFWAGLIFGLMFSFHFSQIPLVGVVILLFWFKKNIYKIHDWLVFLLGVIIPNVTLIWQDKSLVLWLPYRIANIADKNPAGTWAALNEYFGKNIFWDQRLWLVGLIVFAVIFGHYIIKNKKRFMKDFLPFYLISSISLMVVANILHGAPPLHYFLPIFTAVPILLSIYLSKFRFWPLIFVPVLLINLISFNSDPLFYGTAYGFIPSIDPSTDFIPYSTQNMMASFIVSNAGGHDLAIKRIGPYDYFPEQYSQNYKYLVLWDGGNLVDNSSNIYLVREDVKTGTVTVEK